MGSVGTAMMVVVVVVVAMPSSFPLCLLLQSLLQSGQGQVELHQVS